MPNLFDIKASCISASINKQCNYCSVRRDLKSPAESLADRSATGTIAPKCLKPLADELKEVWTLVGDVMTVDATTVPHQFILN